MDDGRSGGHSSKRGVTAQQAHENAPGRDSHSPAEKTLRHHPTGLQNTGRNNPQISSYKYLRPGHKGR
jgi:hypothetical protein